MTVRSLPITPGTSDLLHVTLEALGKVVVHDASDVTLVQAHAEGDSGDDDAQTARHEGVLHALPVRGGQAGVVALSVAGADRFRRLLGCGKQQYDVYRYYTCMLVRQ